MKRGDMTLVLKVRTCRRCAFDVAAFHHSLLQPGIPIGKQNGELQRHARSETQHICQFTLALPYFTSRTSPRSHSTVDVGVQPDFCPARLRTGTMAWGHSMARETRSQQ